MNAIEMIKSRRSIRKFKDEVVKKETVDEIMEITKFAPSWANGQISRYTFITDEAMINRISTEGVNDFVYNIKTLKNAKNVLVLSYVEGKSGKLSKEQYNMDYDSETDAWEIFDSGIACQTFCLAAHANGVGTVIMGVINNETIAEIINLPKEEKVAAVIVYGYPLEDKIAIPSRKNIEEISRFL